jgi:16S rRNA (guanine966-N2)-methyltransferase
MKLRIISGSLKGRFITVHDSGDFRPTSERTRESLTEIIKYRLKQTHVADICAGSGAMGFEMLSRGAAQVDFVEPDRARAEQIKKNASILGVSEQCRIFTKNVKLFIEKSIDYYDFIFYDPPYDDEELRKMVLPLRKRLADSGLLLYESRKKRQPGKTISENTDEHPEDIRIFGDTQVEFFNKIKSVT